ncbi:hypothetical protein Bca4012_030404 [Brassica carinata]
MTHTSMPLQKIKDISCDAEVGKLYECTVKSILKEGLVIEYNGGRHGLLHIFLSCPLKRFLRFHMCYLSANISH